MSQDSVAPTIHTSFRDAMANGSSGLLHKVEIDREALERLLKADSLYLRCETPHQGRRHLAEQLLDVARLSQKDVNELVREDYLANIVGDKQKAAE